jgi:hypothetical protein
MIEYVKSILPTYIHGMNSEQLSDLLNGVIKDDWTSVIYDGSSYDSLQTSEIMEIVDTPLWKEIAPFILKNQKKTIPDLTKLKQKHIIRCATSLTCTAKSYMKHGGKRRVYAKYKLNGTVFSGASNKTTL